MMTGGSIKIIASRHVLMLAVVMTASAAVRIMAFLYNVPMSRQMEYSHTLEKTKNDCSKPEPKSLFCDLWTRRSKVGHYWCVSFRYRHPFSYLGQRTAKQLIH
mmetsp:Transcript_10710/g.23362  ORF Transcript_10710/g.23362 Transcript_10710/m.23362 type:complete len:103 (-) Transcript_10710:83-391(-)